MGFGLCIIAYSCITCPINLREWSMATLREWPATPRHDPYPYQENEELKFSEWVKGWRSNALEKKNLETLAKENDQQNWDYDTGSYDRRWEFYNGRSQLGPFLFKGWNFEGLHSSVSFSYKACFTYSISNHKNFPFFWQGRKVVYCFKSYILL